MSKSVPKEGHFLVIQEHPQDEKTRRLVKVISLADDASEYYCVVEKNRHLHPVRVTVKPDQVVLNLGPKPALGMVYGQDTTKIYLGHKQHEAFGDIHFFFKPTKEQWQRFTVSMDRVARRLSKLRMDCLLDGNVVHEVHHHRGKYAGMFIKSSNPEKNPHRIEYYVDAVVDSYDYLICHELGHYMHLVGLADYPKVNAAWIRLYNQTIRPREITVDRCSELLDDLVAQDLPPSEWAREQEDEIKAEWKLLFKWMSQVRGLGWKELDTLWGEDGAGKDEVVKLMPKSQIYSKDIKPSVSEYATKSHKELVAESLAFYMTKKELPAKVHELLEKSIPIARNSMTKDEE